MKPCYFKLKEVLSGLMVSTLDSRSSDLGLSPGWGHIIVFCSNGKYTLPSQSWVFSTQVYKWVLVNLILRVKPCDGLTSHPGENRNTPSHFMLLKPEISADLMGLKPLQECSILSAYSFYVIRKVLTVLYFMREVYLKYDTLGHLNVIQVYLAKIIHYSLSPKTVNMRENFWNVYCFTNQSEAGWNHRR